MARCSHSTVVYPVHTGVYWRFVREVPGPWTYGWISQGPAGLIRMGLYNGATTEGPMVDPAEIEWRDGERR